MKRVSFTLTELLVVISTIALLVAIFIPVLRSSRQQVKATLCASNIKQLTSGLFMYETQNKTLPYGFYDAPMMTVPPGGYAGFEYDRTGWWWFNFIEVFYRKSDRKITVVQCPSYRLTNAKF